MNKAILKHIILNSILLFFASSVFAQYDTTHFNKPKPPKKFDFSKFFIGGNMGMQFGTVTFIDASPAIGYKLTEKLLAGIGGTYIYMRDNNYSYTNKIYGGRVFGRYLILENIFAHAEYESLNGQWDFYTNRRYNLESVLVGGGYRQRVGANAFMNLMALWNVNDSELSPYQNPIIRVGFGMGF
ncbi:MAG: hypothetical protein J0M08_06620 [Bacteroidetes bacterium]|nr:hypothetical protein [Bacteroidota bacterium]